MPNKAIVAKLNVAETFWAICGVCLLEKITAIKISSYPIELRVLSNAGEMVLELKCALENERFWNLQSWHRPGATGCPGGHLWGSDGRGEGERERERKIIHINCKRCRRGQILPEAVTASFCVKFLDRKPPACWWILNGNQSWLNKCLPLPLPLLWINSTLFIQFLELTEC